MSKVPEYMKYRRKSRWRKCYCKCGNKTDRYYPERMVYICVGCMADGTEIK